MPPLADGGPADDRSYPAAPSRAPVGDAVPAAACRDREAVLADVLADRFPHPMGREAAARRMARRWAGHGSWAVAAVAGFAAGWLAGASGGSALAAAYLVGAASLAGWATFRWGDAVLEPLCSALLDLRAVQGRVAAATELGLMPGRGALDALLFAAERDLSHRVREAALVALAASLAVLNGDDGDDAIGLCARLAPLLPAAPPRAALAILGCLDRFDIGAAHGEVQRTARQHPDREVRAAAARLEPVLRARAERLRWQNTLVRPSPPGAPLVRPAPASDLPRPASPPTGEVTRLRRRRKACA